MKRKRLLPIIIIAVSILALLVPISNIHAAPKEKLNITSAIIEVGKTVQLKALNTKRSIKWSSRNKSIATVSGKGLVKGKKAGKTTINARIGNKTFTCKITVSKTIAEDTKETKILIAFFSRVGNTNTGDGIDAVTSASLRADDTNISIGNTGILANMIKFAVGGDVVQIEPADPYPKDYIETRNRYKEELASGYIPPLSTKIENMESYNIVYLGYPTWGMRLPPAVKAFLSEYDFSGKTIVPFNTNGGYGIGDTVSSIKEFAPNAKVIDEAFSVGGKEAESSQDALNAWLRQIGMLKKSNSN